MPEIFRIVFPIVPTELQSLPAKNVLWLRNFIFNETQLIPLRGKLSRRCLYYSENSFSELRQFNRRHLLVSHTCNTNQSETFQRNEKMAFLYGRNHNAAVKWYTTPSVSAFVV